MESVEGKPFRFTGFILTNRGVADPNGTQPNILSKDDLNMDIVAGTVDVLEIIQRILRKQLS